MRVAPAVAVLLMGVAACQARTESAEQMQTRMQSEEAAFRAVVDTASPAFANHLNQGHADIVAAYYTDDATIMPPNMPAVTGKEGGKKVFGEFIAMKANLTLKPEAVSANGSMAIERGTYSVTFTPPGATAPITDTGKYLVHWKNVDGKWLIANDAWNSDLPAAPMPAPKP